MTDGAAVFGQQLDKAERAIRFGAITTYVFCVLTVLAALAGVVSTTHHPWIPFLALFFLFLAIAGHAWKITGLRRLHMVTLELQRHLDNHRPSDFPND